MNTFITLALDTRKPKTDGTSPIILRIVHHSASTSISLRKYVTPKDWDVKTRLVKTTYKGTQSVTHLNNWLTKKKTLANDVLIKLDEKKTLDSLTIFQLKELIENKPESSSFLSFGDKLVEEFTEVGRLGNARAYKSTLGVLRTYRKDKDLLFSEVTPGFLRDFEHEHLKKGNVYNGLAVYMRTIRAIYNRGIRDGLTDKEHYPFTHYTIKTEKTRKRAISVEAIKTIQQLELATDHPLYHTRNYFLVSFYLRGMPFTDLAHLKVADIIDGRVFYARQKTGTNLTVKITEEIHRILEIYLPGKSKEDFVLPIIKRTTPQDQYADVEWARKRFNMKLKKLAKLCKIDENITSYVSRHSFATRAKNLGIPIASISDMLGHSNTQITEVYLDTLPSDTIDELHAQIIR